jgi:hypothetical protein
MRTFLLLAVLSATLAGCDSPVKPTPPNPTKPTVENPSPVAAPRPIHPKE